MKLLLSALLVLLTILACFLEDAYLHFLPPKPGQNAPLTFRAGRPFNFDQEKAFGGKRKLAISQYIPLYTHIPDGFETTNKKMLEILKRVSAIQSGPQSEKTEFLKYLRKELGLDMSDEAAAQFLAYANIRNLLEAIKTIQETILQSRIVEDPQPIKGKKTAEILFPEPVGAVALPASELVTVDEARLDLQKKIYQVFWQIDKSVLDPVVKIAVSALSPNLRYDQKENDRRIEEIIRRYPSKIIPFEAGAVLVPFRKVMTEEDVLLLAAHQEVAERDFLKSAPWIFLAVVSMLVLYNLFLSRVLQPWLNRKPPVLLMLSLLVAAVVLMEAFLLLTTLSVYTFPYCFLPILLALLEREKISASWTTLLGAMLVSFVSGPTAEIFLFFSLGGLLAILLSNGIRKQFHVLAPSFFVGLSNMMVSIIFFLDWKTLAFWLSGNEKAASVTFGALFNGNLFSESAWAFLGGLAAGPVALLLLPLMEFAWRRVSTFQLNKYSDLQHPLMRDLLTKAPGTYQHTMSVAYLAEAAGEAVGANTLLLRVGAYYHDIGKMADPKFFIENQFGVNNPHDELNPSESVQKIMEHVRNGIGMGRKAGLPDVVLDFIPQHHGCQLVEYFYDKACKESQENKPDEQDFRYPGPKPQSIETAILMIVDAVEAASRTVQEPTPEKIKSLLRFIVQKRIADGQFDECNLSTQNIHKIIQTLAETLEASFHTRVEYPWQRNERERTEEEHALELK